MLSDEQVIARLKRDFVPVFFNITTDGWPKALPGLRPWRSFYKLNFTSRFGFFAHVVLDPTGEFAVATAGDGRREVHTTSACYHVDRYLKFLDRGQVRLRELARLQREPVEWKRKLQLGGFKLRMIGEIGKTYRRAAEEAGLEPKQRRR